jgi:hypothetical protein
MNPLKERDILDDKRLFYKYYGEYFKHRVFTIEDLVTHPLNVDVLFQFNKMVFKVSDGKCGIGVNILDVSELKKEDVIDFMRINSYDMVETFVVQHSELNRISPSAVNTVRIFTQLNSNNNVDILGCRQRISINSSVDNLAAGNIAAPINQETGIIEGPGVYSDITKDVVFSHPITDVSIVGFQVPFWKDCIALAVNAALKHPQNRSIGWDIVVTENGPGLIEGNHDWCKLLWQLPVNQGLKRLLINYV